MAGSGPRGLLGRVAAGAVGAAGEAAPRAEEPETIEGAVRADRSLVTGAPRPTEPEDR